MAGITDDTFTSSVEHVISQQQFQKRLGNMTLVDQPEMLCVDSFAKKRIIYSNSNFLLAQEVGKKSVWGLEEIEARQQLMAKMAVKIWPF